MQVYGFVFRDLVTVAKIIQSFMNVVQRAKYDFVFQSATVSVNILRFVRIEVCMSDAIE